MFQNIPNTLGITSEDVVFFEQLLQAESKNKGRGRPIPQADVIQVLGSKLYTPRVHKDNGWTPKSMIQILFIMKEGTGHVQVSFNLSIWNHEEEIHKFFQQKWQKRMRDVHLELLTNVLSWENRHLWLDEISFPHLV